MLCQLEVVPTYAGEKQTGLGDTPVNEDNVWAMVLCAKGGLPQTDFANMFV